MVPLNHQELDASNQQQIDDARGPVNRYYAYLNLKPDHKLSDDELVFWYIEQGGAKEFDKRREEYLRLRLGEKAV